MATPSGGAADAPLNTFPRLLLEHARLRGDKPAIREKDLGIWQTWTWAQVAAEARAMACGLAELGFRRGDRLAIIGDNRPRLYIAMSAAQILGGIPVPMYQDAVAAEMSFVLQDAGIHVAIVEDQESTTKGARLELFCRGPRMTACPAAHAFISTVFPCISSSGAITVSPASLPRRISTATCIGWARR